MGLLFIILLGIILTPIAFAIGVISACYIFLFVFDR